MKAPSFCRIALAVAVTLIASCRDEHHLQALQDEVRALTERQSKAQSELNRIKTQLNAVSKERDQLKQDKATLEADLETARKSLESLQKNFAAYKSQYKLGMQQRAPGMSLGSLMVEGKNYQNVKVRESSDQLLAVIHDGGSAKFAWSSLPDPIQRLFGQSPDDAPDGSNGSPDEAAEPAAVFEAEMLNLEKQIGEGNHQIKLILQDMQKNSAAAIEARVRKDDQRLLTLEQAKRAYETQLMKARAEIKTLTERQQSLMRSDPRRKKK